MSYLTVTDLRLTLAPDGDPADLGSAASLSDVELAGKIGEAQAEVDATLGERYTVPFPDGSVPPLVKAVTTAVAAYLATLTDRREPLLPGDPVLLAYQRAEDLLKRLANGSMTLGVGEPEAGGEPVAVNPLDGRLFCPADFGIGPRVGGLDSMVTPVPWGSGGW